MKNINAATPPNTNNISMTWNISPSMEKPFADLKMNKCQNQFQNHIQNRSHHERLSFASLYRNSGCLLYLLNAVVSKWRTCIAAVSVFNTAFTGFGSGLFITDASARFTARIKNIRYIKRILIFFRGCIRRCICSAKLVNAFH